MDDIELSIMQRDADSEAALRPFLDSFQARQRGNVHVQKLDWTKGRSDLTKMALYHQGSDVSEVGTTWISDLISMNALRPFSASEVIQTGPAEAFLPATWATTQMIDESQVWSIPWLAETFTLHYRSDILGNVGLDPTTALATPQQMLETVRRLKASGYSIPIALPPISSRTLIVHIAASWVWQAGADFLSPDSREVAFTEPAALEAFTTYFDMIREISAEGLQKLESDGVAKCFLRGDAPLAVGGLWLHPRFATPGSIDPAVWGVTRLPGPPFVGGSNLVIWKHTHHDRAALSLVQMLAGEAASANYANQIAMLPTRTRLSGSAQYQEDRFARTTYDSIINGRTYPTFPLWGLVEDRLANVLTGLWEGVTRDPEFDFKDKLPRSLNQLARSLNLTLSQR